MRVALLLGLGLASNVACNALGLSCTDMGCSGTLTVFLDRAPAADAVITMDVGDGESYVCGFATETQQPLCTLEEIDGAPVLSMTVGMGQAPETVTVTVSEAGAEPVDHLVTVEWGEPWYPNGKACDGKDGGCSAGDGDLSLDG